MNRIAFDQLSSIRRHKYYEVRELVDFIGGFDKWSLLNEDCRREVVKHLEYGTLCELKSCSKADYELVKKMPIKVCDMEISEASLVTKEEPTWIQKTNSITVLTTFNNWLNESTFIQRVFTQKGSDTHVSVQACFDAQQSRSRFVLESTNYYAAAMEYVDLCLKKCKYEVDGLKVQMTGNPFSNLKLERLVRCNNVEMGIDNIEMFNWWIRRLPEKMKTFLLYKFMYADFEDPIRSEFLSLPQIKQVKHLGLSLETSLTDEQFLNLRNSTFSSENLLVTNEAVNQFLKRWVKGKGNQEFKHVHLNDFRQNQNPNIILQGLQAREWDDEFKREQNEFVKKFKDSPFFPRSGGKCFQINSSVDPFESITLVFGHWLSIVKTGTKTVKRGKTITSYSVPRPYIFS